MGLMMFAGRVQGPDQPGPMLQRLRGLQQAVLRKPGGIRAQSYAINPDLLPDPENLQIVVYVDGVKTYAGPISGWAAPAMRRGIHIQWLGGGIFWDPND